MLAGKQRHMHTHAGMVTQRSASRQLGPIPLACSRFLTLPMRVEVDLHRAQVPSWDRLLVGGVSP